MINSTVIEIGVWNGWIFMSVFIWQMIIILFVGRHARRQSHVPNDMNRTPSEKYIGIIANFIWFIALIYSIFLPLILGTIWFYAGFFVFLLGVLLLSIATFHFMATPMDQMIEKGAYKISRHPMYLSTFLICLGTGIATASWIFIILCIIISLCFHFEALVEERYCLNIYRDQYKKYMNNVPRWIGFPK